MLFTHIVRRSNLRLQAHVDSEKVDGSPFYICKGESCSNAEIHELFYVRPVVIGQGDSDIISRAENS